MFTIHVTVKHLINAQWNENQTIFGWDRAKNVKKYPFWGRARGGRGFLEGGVYWVFYGNSYKTCNFRAHKVMHDESYTGFQCDLCQKVLHTKGSLTRHRLVYHSNERPWSCSRCPKRFKTKKDLKVRQVPSYAPPGPWYPPSRPLLSRSPLTNHPLKQTIFLIDHFPDAPNLDKAL